MKYILLDADTGEYLDQFLERRDFAPIKNEKVIDNITLIWKYRSLEERRIIPWGKNHGN